jgi:hypothetical protein
MMPTIPSLLADLLHSIASYQDIIWGITVVICALLGISGIHLLNSSAPPGRRQSLTLLAISVLLALAVGLPFFIPYTHYDFLVPGVPFFPLWMLDGLLLGLAIVKIGAHRPLAAVLSILGVMALTPAVVVGTSSLLGMGYTPNIIWGFYPVPPVLAGLLFAWALARRDDKFKTDYRLYLGAWLLVTALILLPVYIGEMDKHQYTLESASTWLRYQGAPEAQPLIDGAIRGELESSVVYVSCSVGLLFLPLLSTWRLDRSARRLTRPVS